MSPLYGLTVRPSITHPLIQPHSNGGNTFSFLIEIYMSLVFCTRNIRICSGGFRVHTLSSSLSQASLKPGCPMLVVCAVEVTILSAGHHGTSQCTAHVQDIRVIPHDVYTGAYSNSLKVGKE